MARSAEPKKRAAAPQKRNRPNCSGNLPESKKPRKVSNDDVVDGTAGSHEQTHPRAV